MAFVVSGHPRSYALPLRLFVLLACLLLPLPGLAFTLPDSSQTKCYNNTDQITCPTDSSAAFYGQDANRMSAPINLTDNGNQTVTDNNTGLVWQQSSVTTAATWDEANTYCQQLTLGGLTGWRLPSRRELGTLLVFVKFGPTVSYLIANPNTMEYTWSGTQAYGDTSKVFMFSTADGVMAIVNKDSPNYTMTTRCVHGDQLPEFSASAGTDTITDTTTNLMWQKNPDSTQRNWQAALSQCEGLELGGYSDWRLPTISELYTLSDTTRNPVIPEGFGNMHQGSVWSNDTLDANKDNAMSMDVTSTARSYRTSKLPSWYPTTLCVRGGPSLAASLGSFVAGAVTAPAAETRLTYENAATLQWNTTALTGSTVDLYAIVDSLGELSDATPNAAIASRLASVKFASGVSNTGTYTFYPPQLNYLGGRVKILVVSDTHNWSMTAGSLIVEYPSSPIAPTATAATSVKATGFTANWNNVYGATSYLLSVYDATTQAVVSGYDSLDVGNVLTYPVTGLTAGHSFKYAVKAKNSSGTSSDSNMIDVKYQAPNGSAANMLLLEQQN